MAHLRNQVYYYISKLFSTSQIIQSIEPIMANYRGTSDPNYPQEQAARNSSRQQTSTATDEDDTPDELRALKWINLIAYALNVTITYGIGVLGLFGLPTNGDLSAKYQSIMTPAGYAFSIWAIIFAFQAVWCVQQFFLTKPALIAAVVRVRCTYALVVLAQCSWTLTFSNELIPVSAGVMLLILLNLTVLVRSLATLELPSSTSSEEDSIAPWLYYLRAVFPFAVHFGWILAASVVNLNVVLVDTNLSRSVQLYGGALGGLLVVLLAALALVWYRYVTAPVVLIWALGGIFVELGNPLESIQDTFTLTDIKAVRYASVVVAAVIVVALVVGRWVRPAKANGVTTSSGSSRRASATEPTPYVRAVDGAGRL